MIKNLIHKPFISYIIAYIFKYYLYFVFITSKIEIKNLSILESLIKEKNSFILALWHQHIMASGMFITIILRKLLKDFKTYSIISPHKDTLILQKYAKISKGFIIKGSSNKKKHKQNISIKEFKKILKILKRKNNILKIAVDGPKGPFKNINGNISNIALKTDSKIIAFSIYSSKVKKLNTWDKFIILLPFSKIIFSISDKIKLNPDNNEKENNEIIKREMNNNFLQSKI